MTLRAVILKATALSALLQQDGKKAKQITIGLITDSKGFPLKMKYSKKREIINGKLVN